MGHGQMNPHHGHQDPSFNGAPAAGLASVGSGANLSSFTGALPGQSPNGMMNPNDPSAAAAAAAAHAHHGLLQQQQQAALASLQNPGAAAFQQQYGQNNLYSDLMNMNRMGFGSNIYGAAPGGMNNFDYISALQQQRNALASSALGFNGVAGVGGYNPYLQGDAALLGGLQAAANAGVDPRLSPYKNQSLLGASGSAGDTNGAVGASYAGALSIPSMMMTQAQMGVPGVASQGNGSPSRILMEQMNQANLNQQAASFASQMQQQQQQQPHEENKQNAVEQLLSLGKDPSGTKSTATVVNTKKEVEGEKTAVPKAENSKDEPNPVVKDVMKTEVLAL